MTEATNNTALDRLREDVVLLESLALRGDLGDVKNDMSDMKARLASIESYIATLHSDQTCTNVEATGPTAARAATKCVAGNDDLAFTFKLKG